MRREEGGRRGGGRGAKGVPAIPSHSYRLPSTSTQRIQDQIRERENEREGRKIEEEKGLIFIYHLKKDTKIGQSRMKLKDSQRDITLIRTMERKKENEKKERM